MESHILTKKELYQLFREITLDKTGLEGRQVRIAYQPDGQPAQEIKETTAYLFMSTVPNQYDKQREVVYRKKSADLAEQIISYTRVVQVLWTIYGPDAFDIADQLRNGVLEAESLSTLRAQNVAPLTDIDPAVTTPYPLNEQWWERSDLTVFFNVKTVRVREIPLIKSADIHIYSDHGLERVVEVQEP